MPRNLRLFLALALLCPAALAAVCTSIPLPSSAEFSWTGGSGSFVVFENALCQQGQPWTPVASAPWITITGGGTGMTTVSYTVAPNLSTFPREGTITGLPVGSSFFFITQAAAPVAAVPALSGTGIGLLAGTLALLGAWLAGRR